MGRTYRKRRRQNKFQEQFSLAHTPELCSLKRWLRVKGYNFVDNLKPFKFRDTGRGMLATQNLSPGDLIISIPYDVMISTETIMQNEDLCKRLKKYKEKFSAPEAIALYLLKEKQKGDSSEWLYYFATLPQAFSTSSYFTDEEMSLLPESAKYLAREEQKKFLSFFHKVSDFCSIHFHEMPNIDLCKWAWYVVNTRCVYITCTRLIRCDYFTDVNDNVALAPYLDLLNHSPFAKTEAGYNEETGTFDIKTLDEIKKYEQVFICYGSHDNSKLFVEYGFTLPINPHNTIEFCIDELRSLEGEFHIQHMAQKDLILQDPDFLKNKPLAISEDGLSWKLLRSLTVLCLTWEELKSWKRILHESSFCEHYNSQICDMAIFLINKFTKRNVCQLRENVDVTNYHRMIIKSLWRDQEKIIKSCVKLLRTGHVTDS